MKYRLVAIDVDGTLLGEDHKLAAETVEAVGRLQRAGARICIATGRSYIETINIWRQLGLAEPFEPLVLIGGALVAEPGRGRTLYQRAIDRELACSYADELCDAGYSALAIVDAWRWGTDYFIAESKDIDRVMASWFSKMQVKTRRVLRLTDAGDMPGPLRVNAVVPPEQAGELAERLKRKFEGQLNIHSILAPNYGVMIVEAFSAEASKWNGVKYVAQAYRISSSEIVAIGDDVNDLPMISAAGLGVAMAKAPAEVKSAAKVVLQESLAGFLHELADGRYDQ